MRNLGPLEIPKRVLMARTTQVLQNTLRRWLPSLAISGHGEPPATPLADIKIIYLVEIYGTCTARSKCRRALIG